jgi:hypothetical protein
VDVYRILKAWRCILSVDEKPPVENGNIMPQKIFSWSLAALALLLVTWGCGSPAFGMPVKTTPVSAAVISPAASLSPATIASTPPSFPATSPVVATSPVSTMPLPTFTFKLIPHKPGIPPLRPHPVVGFEECVLCHTHPDTGVVKIVKESHPCDQCHARKVIRVHTLPIETACVTCHKLP